MTRYRRPGLPAAPKTIAGERARRRGGRGDGAPRDHLALHPGRRHAPSRRRRSTCTTSCAPAWCDGAPVALATAPPRDARPTERASSRASSGAWGARSGSLPVPSGLAVGRALGTGRARSPRDAAPPSRSSTSRSRSPSSTRDARGGSCATRSVTPGESFAELGLYPKLARRPDYVVFEGQEVLDAALAGGRGAIGVTGHCGNWELLAATVAARRVSGQRGRPAGERPPLPCAHRAGFALPPGSRCWCATTPPSSHGVRDALRRNRIVAMLIDQDTRGAGVFVPFFGRLAHTPPGAAVLALRARVPVVTIFIERRAGGRPPHTRRGASPCPRPRARSGVLELTARLTRAIEAQIRRAPAEWVWWHRRWRRRPPAPSPEVAQVAADPHRPETARGFTFTALGARGTLGLLLRERRDAKETAARRAARGGGRRTRGHRVPRLPERDRATCRPAPRARPRHAPAAGRAAHPELPSCEDGEGTHRVGDHGEGRAVLRADGRDRRRTSRASRSSSRTAVASARSSAPRDASRSTAASCAGSRSAAAWRSRSTISGSRPTEATYDRERDLITVTRARRHPRARARSARPRHGDRRGAAAGPSAGRRPHDGALGCGDVLSWSRALVLVAVLGCRAARGAEPRAAAQDRLFDAGKFGNRQGARSSITSDTLEYDYKANVVVYRGRRAGRRRAT